METHPETGFNHVKGEDGTDFYCETGPDPDKIAPEGDLSENCVESDVVRRYSGNIRVTG